VCIACLAGTLGCTCSGSGTCLSGGVCVSGVCVSEPSEVIPPPDEPRCYSPCQSDLTLANGTVIHCSAEGLIPRCPDNTTCQQGSCVPDGESPRTCASDVECPDFQACLQGACYSNCEYDSDCPAGLDCYRKVCRLPCSTSGRDCAAGQHCTTVDGEYGYCEPTEQPGGEPVSASPGSFSLSEDSIEFTNNKVSHTFEIINNSPQAYEFTIRKLRHIEHTDSGLVYEEANPLFWVRMGLAGYAAQTQSFDVLVDGSGGSTEIELAGVDNDTLSSWDGTIVVENAELGSGNSP
jgi:hypothetical protein